MAWCVNLSRFGRAVGERRVGIEAAAPGAAFRLNLRRAWNRGQGSKCLRKEIDVPRKWTFLVLLSAAIVFAALGEMNTEDAWATSAAGFTATTIMSGPLGQIDIFGQPIIPDSSENDRRAKAWLSVQETTGPSVLYVQSNVWQPGGSTGWHTHPGHSLIIVAAGTVTEYRGPDHDCKPHVYTKGMTFVDPHGDHVHIIRNEGDAVARTFAIQLIPAGAARRIDFPDPGNCRF
jgi:quercetin dioxygenase-like cupin family protein